MPLLKIQNDVLSPLGETDIALEKDLQALTEKNLSTVFGLDFVSTEFALQGLRLDTVAFDPETRSFVIIEYKRDRSFSVIDQGFAYLALLLNNKADFLLEYNEKRGASLKREEVDWSQSRVLFLAQSFTAHQLQAINFKDLPIELWEVTKYGNELISYHQIEAEQFSESLKTVTKSEVVSSVSREVRVYSTDEIVGKAKGTVRELMEAFRVRILELDGRFAEKANSQYLAFKINRRNVLALTPMKDVLLLSFPRIEPKDLNDPLKRLESRGSEEMYGQKLTDMSLKDEHDIPYALELVQQVIARQDSSVS